jgi:hypothetical protein
VDVAKTRKDIMVLLPSLDVYAYSLLWVDQFTLSQEYKIMHEQYLSKKPLYLADSTGPEPKTVTALGLDYTICSSFPAT